jgi:hypothetical protein
LGESIPGFSSGVFSWGSTYEPPHYAKLYPITPFLYTNNDPLCMLNFFSWMANNLQPGALLCDEFTGKWKICDETSIGLTNAPSSITSVQNQPVLPNQQLTHTCTLNSQGGYEWVSDAKLLPWFKYSTLELFGNDDNSYPDQCDTSYDEVFFACDSRGQIGVAEEFDLDAGSFPCPTEAESCNTFAQQWESYAANYGCKLILSEDDDALSNDCAYAQVPEGSYVGSSYSTTFNLQESPWGDDDAKCLTKHYWSSSRYEGDFICGPNAEWYLCESRKKNACLTTGGEEWCCIENIDGNYVFTKTAASTGGTTKS